MQDFPIELQWAISGFGLSRYCLLRLPWDIFTILGLGLGLGLWLGLGLVLEVRVRGRLRVRVRFRVTDREMVQGNVDIVCVDTSPITGTIALCLTRVHCVNCQTWIVFHLGSLSMRNAAEDSEQGLGSRCESYSAITYRALSCH